MFIMFVIINVYNKTWTIGTTLKSIIGFIATSEGLTFWGLNLFLVEYVHMFRIYAVSSYLFISVCSWRGSASLSPSAGTWVTFGGQITDEVRADGSVKAWD